MKNFITLLCLVFLFEQKTFAQNISKIIITPAKLSIAEFHEKHTAIGQVKLVNSKDYFAKTKGTVDFIFDKQGGEISKDTIVLTIDREIAETMKSQAEANLYMAEYNYNRDLALFEKNIIKEEGVNKSKTTLEQARNDYKKVISTYKDMVIKSTDNASIGVIKANIGDVVKEGDYLFSITTKSDFYIFVELPEILNGKILNSDIVQAYGENGKPIQGKIVAISNYVSDNGTITAKLIFPYNDYLLHGSFVETDIIFNKHKALGVPEKAVLKNNQGDFIYVITPENKAKKTFVTLGIRTNNMIELLSDDVKEGDLIVLDGLTKIYDGSEIIIK